MKWLEETHGTRFELVRHFLTRMLDGEWSSTGGQWQNVAVSAVALALPSVMLLLRSGSVGQNKFRILLALRTPEPFRAAVMADQLGFLTLFFAVTGLLALLQWQNFYPGRRDYLALAGLPIRPRQIFVARFAAVTIFSTAVVLAMNLLPAIAAPFDYSGRWQPHPAHLRAMAAQAWSAGLGCFFILFAIVALQGVLLNTLPARLFARVSSYVQGALAALMILAALYSWTIRDWPAGTIASLPRFADWAPPAWFAGWYRSMLGSADPFHLRMAGRAQFASAAAAALTVAGYLVSYRRYRRVLVESPVHLGVPRQRQWSLLALVSGDPRRQAVMQFMAATLARSRTHRVIWLAYLGGGIGVMLNSSFLLPRWLSTQTLKFIVLIWPIGLSMIFLNGFRHVLSIPADLPANWIFRLTESYGRRYWMSAVERFVLLYAVAPVYVLSLPLAVYLLGWPIALRMTVQQILVSLTIFDCVFFSWQQIPFTCAYSPGTRPLSMVAAGYFALISVVVPILSMMVRASAEFAAPFFIYCPMFLAVWLWARQRRRQGWGEARILYEDLPAGPPDLGIRELTWTQEAP